MQGAGWAVAADGGAWARTIIDVYMVWFTFLVSSNILAASWWYARTPDGVVRSIMMTPFCWAMIVADLSTAAMTFVVASTIKPWAPRGFSELINGAGIANAIVVITFSVVWYLGWSHWRHRERNTGFQHKSK
jgi:hypothetical protein